jgi:hypothetical protein
VALAILGTAGLSLTAVLHEAAQAQAAAREAEATLDAADRVLTAMTLLNRTDLDRRIGRHPVGEFVAEVERPERNLYRLAVALAANPERVLLVTVVHRPEGVSQ